MARDKHQSLFHKSPKKNAGLKELIEERCAWETRAKKAKNLLETSKDRLTPENIQKLEEIIEKSSEYVKRIDNVIK
jgi:hypothetical protein